VKTEAALELGNFSKGACLCMWQSEILFFFLLSLQATSLQKKKKKKIWHIVKL